MTSPDVRASRRAILTAAAATLAACASPRAPREAKPADPQPLPDVVLPRLGAAPMSLAALARGRVTLVDFWASWCSACEGTTARVAQLAQAFSDKGLLVAGINVGEEPSEVERHLSGQVPYPTFLDRQFRLSDALDARKLPTVLVLDRDARVVHRSDRVDRATVALIERLLGERHA